MPRVEQQPNFKEGALGDIRKLGTPVQEAIQVPTGEVRGKGFFDRVLRHPYREVYKLEDSQKRVLGEAEVVNERLAGKKGEKARQEMKIFNSQGELQRIDTTIYDPITRKVDSFEMVDVKTGIPIKEVHRKERWGDRFIIKEHFVDKTQARSVQELDSSGRERESSNFDYVQTPRGTEVSKKSTVRKAEDGEIVQTIEEEIIYDSYGYKARRDRTETNTYPGTVEHEISTAVMKGDRLAEKTFYRVLYKGKTKDKANLRMEYNSYTKYSDRGLIQEERKDVTEYIKGIGGKLEARKAPQETIRYSYDEKGRLLFEDRFEGEQRVMRTSYIGDKKEETDYKLGERRTYRLRQKSKDYSHIHKGDTEDWIRIGTFTLNSDLRSVVPSGEPKKPDTHKKS